MTVPSASPVTFDGSGIDGWLFKAVTNFASETRWLNEPLKLWTNAGLAVFAVLMLIGIWNARRRDARAMALALAAPFAVAIAFAVTEVIKRLAGELRPCYSLAHAYYVDACPARTDYAFPSGHATVAFATVAALWLLDRRLSAIAAAFAIFEGFTRVYLGDHYPHDIAGAAVVAMPVAYLISRIVAARYRDRGKAAVAKHGKDSAGKPISTRYTTYR